MTRHQLDELEQRDLVEPLTRIARAHAATPSEVMSRSREAHVVRARSAFGAWLVANRGWSRNSAARFLGSDRRTVGKAEL